VLCNFVADIGDRRNIAVFFIRHIARSLDPALGKISFMQGALLQRSVNRYHVVGMDPDLTGNGIIKIQVGIIIYQSAFRKIE
jgi:hypothetical protein